MHYLLPFALFIHFSINYIFFFFTFLFILVLYYVAFVILPCFNKSCPAGWQKGLQFTNTHPPSPRGSLARWSASSFPVTAKLSQGCRQLDSAAKNMTSMSKIPCHWSDLQISLKVSQHLTMPTPLASQTFNAWAWAPQGSATRHNLPRRSHPPLPKQARIPESTFCQISVD